MVQKPNRPPGVNLLSKRYRSDPSCSLHWWAFVAQSRSSSASNLRGFWFRVLFTSICLNRKCELLMNAASINRSWIWSGWRSNTACPEGTRKCRILIMWPRGELRWNFARGYVAILMNILILSLSTCLQHFSSDSSFWEAFSNMDHIYHLVGAVMSASSCVAAPVQPVSLSVLCLTCPVGNPPPRLISLSLSRLITLDHSGHLRPRLVACYHRESFLVFFEALCTFVVLYRKTFGYL